MINESKEEDTKSLNNIINNDSSNDNIKNKTEEEQKEKDLDLNEEDFDFFDSSDIFNTIYKKEDKEDNDDDENNEDEDFDNNDTFGKQLLNSLYENPFCTKEKKGNLDELLK